MKLSRVQTKMLHLMNLGWQPYQAAGLGVYVNGARACNRDTMEALVKRGLVIESGRYQWQLTDEGREMAKQITPGAKGKG